MHDTEHIDHPGSVCITPAQATAIAAITRGSVCANVMGSPLRGRRIRVDVWHYSPDATPVRYVVTPEGVIRDDETIRLDAAEQVQA